MSLAAVHVRGMFTPRMHVHSPAPSDTDEVNGARVMKLSAPRQHNLHRRQATLDDDTTSCSDRLPLLLTYLEKKERSDIQIREKREHRCRQQLQPAKLRHTFGAPGSLEKID